jgi:hypothetical protein
MLLQLAAGHLKNPRRPHRPFIALLATSRVRGGFSALPPPTRSSLFSLLRSSVEPLLNDGAHSPPSNAITFKLSTSCDAGDAQGDC